MLRSGFSRGSTRRLERTAALLPKHDEFACKGLLFLPQCVPLTTNKAIRDWPEWFARDEILAPAILDRLPHRAHVLSIRGRSCRLRDLKESLKP